MRATLLLMLVAVSGACTAGKSDDDDDDDGGTERLFVATGEYDASAPWHGILRFENAHAIDSGSSGTPAAPDATLVVDALRDASGIALLFAHALYLNETTDELYIGSLFTNDGNVECGPFGGLGPCEPTSPFGSVGVLSNASTVTGTAGTLSRHLYGGDSGDLTQIHQPHGIWVDESRDILYVANTFGASILAFEPASSADGNLAPTRAVQHTDLGNPVFVYVDEASDTLFAACMNTGTSNQPAIGIYPGISSLDGNVPPLVRIAGPSTRLSEGNNQTTHNVWYDDASQLLFVGHHTNEVLIYDLSTISLTPSMPTTEDLAPRVIEVNTSAADVDLHSVYGLFYVPEDDRLYVSVGVVSSYPGPPAPGTPPNVIKVYDGVSDPSVSGIVTPTRTLHWDGGSRFYPPQPLWVVREP